MLSQLYGILIHGLHWKLGDFALTEATLVTRLNWTYTIKAWMTTNSWGPMYTYPTYRRRVCPYFFRNILKNIAHFSMRVHPNSWNVLYVQYVNRYSLARDGPFYTRKKVISPKNIDLEKVKFTPILNDLRNFDPHFFRFRTSSAWPRMIKGKGQTIKRSSRIF